VTSLSGRLAPGALADLLQYLALSRASGCLLLRHPQRRHAYVYLENGRVAFVDARPLYDVAALSELLGWQDGRFAFRAGIPAPRRTIDMATDALLLEATRRADEPALSSVDPDAVLTAVNGEPAPPRRPADNGLSRGAEEGTPFGPVRVLGDPGPAQPRGAPESVSLSLAALHLWRRLDGTSSLRELAAAAGRPLAEVVAAGEELLEHGLARYVSVAVADPRFAQELAREAVDLLGPVGEIVVEDALYELGLSADAVPVSRVDELVAAVESAFGDGHARQEFSRRAAELRALFALDAAPAWRQ
jgi:hypothetical protein